MARLALLSMIVSLFLAVADDVPDLRVSATPSEAGAVVGQTVAHTITVSNAGAGAAAAATVTEDWSGGFSFVTVTPSSGTCSVAGNGVTCDVGALAPGAQATVTVTGKATAVGPWGGSISAFVPQSGRYPVGTTYALTITAPQHRRTPD
jgi:uncharacterized repeat protein (TIGR01451 family)